MYSPKINENLIPRLYQLAKVLKVPMTKLVSNIIEEHLDVVQSKVVKRHNAVTFSKSKTGKADNRRAC